MKNKKIIGDGLMTNIAKHTNKVVFRPATREDFDELHTELMERGDWISAGMMKHLLPIFEDKKHDNR